MSISSVYPSVVHIESLFPRISISISVMTQMERTKDILTSCARKARYFLGLHFSPDQSTRGRASACVRMLRVIRCRGAIVYEAGKGAGLSGK